MRFRLRSCSQCTKLGLPCAVLLLLAALCPRIEPRGARIPTTVPMLETEWKALFAALDALAGNWSGSELYPDPCSTTPIQGIACDQIGEYYYITALNVGALYENSVSCSPTARIHPAIFGMRHLKTLSFFMCFQSYPQAIPQAWGLCGKALNSLSFRNNSALVGELPAALGGLANLEVLVVAQNRNLTGALPAELGGLCKLRKLALGHNGLRGSIPPEIGRLRNLLILDLAWNGLGGSLPPELGGLESAVEMDISHNALTGSIPPELGRIRALAVLDLRVNDLRGRIPSSLTEIAGLEELYLGNNPGMGGCISALPWSNLRNLRSLDLSTSRYEGTVPASLGKLIRLRYIALNHNRLSGGVPSELAELPHLNALYLNGNNLSGRVEFPQQFYQRMGRRLALWDNNPGLCAAVRNYDPVGINPCVRLAGPDGHAAPSWSAAVGSPASAARCDRSISAAMVLTLNLAILCSNIAVLA